MSRALSVSPLVTENFLVAYRKSEVVEDMGVAEEEDRTNGEESEWTEEQERTEWAAMGGVDREVEARRAIRDLVVVRAGILGRLSGDEAKPGRGWWCMRRW